MRSRFVPLLLGSLVLAVVRQIGWDGTRFLLFDNIENNGQESTLQTPPDNRYPTITSNFTTDNHNSLESSHNMSHDSTLRTLNQTIAPNSRIANSSPSIEITIWDDQHITIRRHQFISTMPKAGVVIFYHVAKTGGSTIRDMVSSWKHVRFQRVQSFDARTPTFGRDNNNVTIDIHRKRPTIRTRIHDILQGRRDELLFLELHGNIPSIPTLSQFIAQSRQTSQTNGIPFFTLTLIREPISFYVSYFLFFHHRKCHYSWCAHDLYNATEENLRISAIPNRQCGFLVEGQLFMRSPIRKGSQTQNITLPYGYDDPSKVWKYFQNDWDWVGTTDTLDSTTIPLLQHLLQGPHQHSLTTTSNTSTTTNTTTISRSKAEATPDKQRLHPRNLHATTIQYLQNLSTCDHQVYDWAKTRYQMSIT